jgi:hypothetical protein
MKILILGAARSGKDSLAELWNKNFGLTYKSSSEMANELFIYDELKDKFYVFGGSGKNIGTQNYNDLWYFNFSKL